MESAIDKRNVRRLKDIIVKQEFCEFLRMLTKETSCQTPRNAARQGNKLANEGTYTGVCNRNLQVSLTQWAEIFTSPEVFQKISAFAGVISGLRSSANSLSLPIRSQPKFLYSSTLSTLAIRVRRGSGAPIWEGICHIIFGDWRLKSTGITKLILQSSEIACDRLRNRIRGKRHIRLCRKRTLIPIKKMHVCAPKVWAPPLLRILKPYWSNRSP